MIEDTKINKNNFENLNYKLKVVDNFLSQSDYESLCKLEINKSFNKGFMVYHNEINDNGIIKSVIDKKLLQELYKSKVITIRV